MAKLLQRVKKIVAEQLGVDEADVTPSTSFTEDLNADSLDLVELIMVMEEEFSTPGNKFEIPDEDAEKMTTVQDVMDYLKEHGVEDK